MYAYIASYFESGEVTAVAISKVKLIQKLREDDDDYDDGRKKMTNKEWLEYMSKEPVYSFYKKPLIT